MPVVEQQPEPGRSSHGSPSELLSWLFFLIGLFRDPHFSTFCHLLQGLEEIHLCHFVNIQWINGSMLFLFCHMPQVRKGTLYTRTNQCLDTPCKERSVSKPVPKCFSCLFVMCACAWLVGVGKKGPHSRVCCIIMSSQVGTAGRCQLHYTRQHPKL